MRFTPLLSLAILALLGLQACSTENIYNKTPYEDRTAGDGEYKLSMLPPAEPKATEPAQCQEDYWKQQAMNEHEKAKGWYAEAMRLKEVNERLRNDFTGCLRK